MPLLFPEKDWETICKHSPDAIKIMFPKRYVNVPGYPDQRWFSLQLFSLASMATFNQLPETDFANYFLGNKCAAFDARPSTQQ